MSQREWVRRFPGRGREKESSTCKIILSSCKWPIVLCGWIVGYVEVRWFEKEGRDEWGRGGRREDRGGAERDTDTGHILWRTWKTKMLLVCFALFLTIQLRKKWNKVKEIGSCCENSNYCLHCCWRLNQSKVHGHRGTEQTSMMF